MSKQLLIYENIVPVSKQNHADLSIKIGNDYSFAKPLNSVPLMAGEFVNSAQEYAIVFAGSEEEILPVVVLGLENQNLYIDEQNNWPKTYIPAFIRRYPFVFSVSQQESKLILCIDENFVGCNREGRGERLFDSQGEQTQYLRNILGFLQTYQAHFERTRIFCRRLQEYNLLEQAYVQLSLPSGKQQSLSGFMRVNRERLKSLTDEQILTLARADELELVYLHLHSLQNLARIAERGIPVSSAESGNGLDTAQE